MNEQETTADIIRMIRAEANAIEQSARGSFKVGKNWDGIAFTESDLESALDLAETKRKEADRLEAAHRRDTKELRVEIERLKEERNYSGVRERERLRAKGFAIVPKEQLERGDCAKLREALEDVLEKIDRWRTDGSMEHWQYSQLFDIADDALAAPPRNCDVGTASEQEDRFAKYCRGSNYCAVCPIRKSWDFKNGRRPSCAILWAQMPYEEGAAK